MRTFLIIFCCLISAQALSDNNKDHIASFTQTLLENRYVITLEGTKFSGDGWHKLLREAKAADYLAIGEEHGIAENPLMVSELFQELVSSGYQHLAIEVSPPLAEALSRAASTGINGLRKMYAVPDNRAAFFSMKEEAQMLADIKALLPKQQNIFLGLDYEVLADRYLISRLTQLNPPKAAAALVSQLQEASLASWRMFEQEKNPKYFYSFSGNPKLIADIQTHWTKASPEAAEILSSLRDTFTINQLWMQGRHYQSNQERAKVFRKNWLHHWATKRIEDNNVKVMLKLGSNHLVRGLNYTRTYDLGSLLPEIAQLENKSVLQLMVIPGKGAQTANFDPVNMRYVSKSPKDGYHEGLELITEHAYKEGFTLVHLAPLREKMTRSLYKSFEVDLDKLEKLVFGFDYLLIMTGSTPSSDLLQE